MKDHPELELVEEHRLAELLPPPPDGRFEASGVLVRGREVFVALDNTRRIARIPRTLTGAASWIDLAGRAPGFEDLTYGERSRRFFLLVESTRSGKGYASAIDEYDSDWVFRGRALIEGGLESSNKGYEGLDCIGWGGKEYLLAIRERGRRDPGVSVLRRDGDRWRVAADIDLLRAAHFSDFSAVAAHGPRLALLSQEEGLLWVGAFRPGKWTVDGGRVFRFPPSKRGKRRYCNVEGLDWLGPDRLVVVSDRAKRRSQPKRCQRRDESVHVFRLPRGVRGTRLEVARRQRRTS